MSRTRQELLEEAKYWRDMSVLARQMLMNGAARLHEERADELEYEARSINT
jgi:hypothetical protein